VLLLEVEIEFCRNNLSGDIFTMDTPIFFLSENNNNPTIIIIIKLRMEQKDEEEDTTRLRCGGVAVGIMDRDNRSSKYTNSYSRGRNLQNKV